MAAIARRREHKGWQMDAAKHTSRNRVRFGRPLVGEEPAWHALGESNPSFQIENLAEYAVKALILLV